MARTKRENMGKRNERGILLYDENAAWDSWADVKTRRDGPFATPGKEVLTLISGARTETASYRLLGAFVWYVVTAGEELVDIPAGEAHLWALLRDEADKVIKGAKNGSQSRKKVG